MFDKLIEIITHWWLQLTPAIIIRDYEEAVLLRFGIFKRVLKPGLHLKIPLFDEVIDQHVVVTTLSLDAQSLYTCLLYTSPSPRDRTRSRMPSSA